MRSVLLILPFAAFTLGCAGHAGNRPVSPAAGSPLTGNSVPTAPTLGDLDSLLTFASGPDSQLVAADVAAERRQAADSAADEAVLEELADARPDSAADDRSGDDEPEAEPGGANGEAVTWDIDVATYHHHNRVQYYLDFFRDRGRVAAL